MTNSEIITKISLNPRKSLVTVFSQGKWEGTRDCELWSFGPAHDETNILSSTINPKVCHLLPIRIINLQNYQVDLLVKDCCKAAFEHITTKGVICEEELYGIEFSIVVTAPSDQRGTW
jgi:hypothetical protein